jgi:hypothetical protein
MSIFERTSHSDRYVIRSGATIYPLYTHCVQLFATLKQSVDGSDQRDSFVSIQKSFSRFQ